MNAKALYRLALIGLVVLLALPASTAQSQAQGPDTSPTMIQEGVSPMAPGAVPGGPGFIMIPASNFSAEEDGTLYSKGGGLVTKVGSPHVAYGAGVFLPNGATITKMVVYYLDRDATNSFGVHLRRMALPGNILDTMADVYTPVSPAGTGEAYLENTTVANSVVNNQTYAYSIEVDIPAPASGSIIVFRGVRIDYNYPVSLPVIQK